MRPRVSDLAINDTTKTALSLIGKVNFTNPTPYSAYIPFASFHLASHGHRLAVAEVQEFHLVRGNVTDAAANVLWDPIELGGMQAQREGQRLISEYLSGKNTTISILCHRGSFPGMPNLGEALSTVNLTLPMPPLDLPRDEDEDEDLPQGFIRDAVFHIFSSAATFRLASPLRHDTITVERINATAFYNHSEAVGSIFYDEAIEVPPGISETPYLPVEWDLDSVGFDKMRDALGGVLRLDTKANVTVRIGNWMQDLYYEGKGIGARIRL